ncbi:MAG: DNA cytosine methyltransferase [Methyloceanibacter sp.]|nr:DNA cytosine methyltransferase [Methyloceanibacter sp.]
MARVYYNEIDPYAAQWLRNLMAAEPIPAGDVDERSIEEVSANDLEGYEQCHFFAGIAGWSRALELANWQGPVWTGSCPCQPFSSAGQAKGLGDERHLWPAFRSLIAQRKPPIVFGEQVASKDGRWWLSGVRADLEDLGYAVGAADLCAAGVGAKQVRQRLYWVAQSRGADVAGFERERSSLCGISGKASAEHSDCGIPARLWDSADTCPAYWFDGLPRPVGVASAYGNAISPQIAAEFISAYQEAIT